MHNNEFLNLVSSPLMNLDHTYRYSGTKLVEKETLSQHIVDCIMMGLKIVDHINYIAGEKELAPAAYVMKAVYHDLEEVITGDIPRPLKYFNEDTLKSMKDVADQVADGFFKKEFIFANEHYNWWKDAKDDKEGFILKIVDNLVVVNKVIKEVSLLNNCYMLRVAHEVSQYTRALVSEFDEHTPFNNKEVNEYLVRILSGAISSMDDILQEHHEVMEGLNIYGQSMI